MTASNRRSSVRARRTTKTADATVPADEKASTAPRRGKSKPAVWIALVPLPELARRRAKRNPKAHRVDEIADAIARRGFNSPPAINEATGNMVAGHGRLEALELLHGRDPAKPPDRIEIGPRGVWMVPTLRGLRFKSDAEAEEHLVADNRLVERGGWHVPMLASVLGDIKRRGKLAGTGYTPVDVAAILRRSRKVTALDETDVPEEPKEPITKIGDVWKLGDHVLVCGDTFQITLPSVDAVVTDPPYAIYGSASGISADVADDSMVVPFFEQLCRLVMAKVKPFGHAYINCDWRSWAALWEGARRAHLTPKNCIVWDKGDNGVGNMFTQCHEMIFFGVREPPPKAMIASKRSGQRLVMGVPNIQRFPRVLGDERLDNAAKNVNLIRVVVEAGTDEGDLVLDAFAGSGTTLIACEQIGRRCYAVDKAPGKCDVIVKRWEKLTGKKAKRAA